MRKTTTKKNMYAIFSNSKSTFVKKCKVVKIEKNGFWAQCHNGGDGLEFFDNEDIGTDVFFSKDSAQKVIDRENI